jgi:hypothetical protein
MGFGRLPEIRGIDVQIDAPDADGISKMRIRRP